MTTREDVMAKLQKLFSLSQSSNEHEAALASQRAAELMAKHQIEAAELEEHVGSTQAPRVESGRFDADEDADWSKREEAWKTQLGSTIAAGLGGKMWRQYGHKVYRFFMIGPPDSVNAARYLYLALSKEIARLSQREMKIRGESNAWRRAYCLGMVARIGSRLAEGRRAALSTSTAMVLVNKMDIAVAEAYDAKNLKDSKIGQRLKRNDGTTEGWIDGGKLDLSNVDDRARLGTGNKKLN